MSIKVVMDDSALACWFPAPIEIAGLGRGQGDLESWGGDRLGWPLGRDREDQRNRGQPGRCCPRALVPEQFLATTFPSSRF